MQRIISPINYKLEFEPNLKDFTFNGKESIDVNCTKATNIITLNAAELKIHKCSMTINGETFDTVTHLNERSEELQIKIPKKIKGLAAIHITFSGILNDRLLGFYRSKYKKNKKTNYLATTQFEAADARRAFPCWDEPDAKATFEISIISESNLTAISNMPKKISKKIKKNKVLHEFSKTPVMSTYLVYMGVGKFEITKSKIGKTIIRVIVTEGNKSKSKFALDIAKRLLQEYENYFGIYYPLPKLDLIAIPDFAAGAMENWGAITFRETILLYDSKTSSTRTKQFIAEVISHEIAHQWFGNLVTMKWWNDLWLNESFATFMATKFVDKFYPEWELWDQFFEDTMNVAMELDALKSSHPIDAKVKQPSEIREIFDAISYDKGGCILRMLENYVGEKNFRKGLKHYLNKFKYKNAQGDDLWKAIGNVSNLPVKQMVDTWIKQVGFPLVEVQQKNSTLVLKQRRFMYLSPKNKSNKKIWHIPISLSNKIKGPTTKILFTKNSSTIKIKKNNAFNMPMIANYGRSGFYRIKYDRSTLVDLKYLITEKRIPHIDRWAIQNDLFALCVAGQASIRDYLDFSDAYIDEKDYLTCTSIAKNLLLLYYKTFGEFFSDEIRKYALNYFKAIFDRLGWDPKPNEKHTDALLRGFVISSLGKLGDKHVLEKAQEQFKKFIKNSNSLRPDLREPILSLVAWYQNNEKTYTQLSNLFIKAKSQEEKLRFLSAMCSFRDRRLLLKTLTFSQTEHVRSQNMQLPIMRISMNPYGKQVLWTWLVKNWSRLHKKIGSGNPLFNRIVSSISNIADDSMKKEIHKFFIDNSTPGTERTVKQTIERIEINSKLLKQLRKEFS